VGAGVGVPVVYVGLSVGEKDGAELEGLDDGADDGNGVGALAI
jgi:hypothetical protein